MNEFIQNGQATGGLANVMLANNFDVGALRPWIGNDGQSYITANVAGVPTKQLVQNANTTLRKDEWKFLDAAVVKAAQSRLVVVGAMRAAGLSYNVPNAMGKTVLETERQGDISAAISSMDGLNEGQADRPEYDLVNLPLPITHKDFHFSARQIQASRNGGSPLDTSTAELAARKVSEQIEKLTLGVASTYSFGGGTIYGFENFPNRLTKTLTDPATSGWTGADLVGEVLAMKTQSQNAYHYGPWKLLCSTNWDAVLDADYSTSKGDLTLRERLAKIEGVQMVQTVDFLSANTMILVQQTTDVARIVNGVDLTTVQWESHGGMRINFKVMAIMVPQLRADINNNTGIVHGSY